MSVPKIILVLSVALFAGIGIVALVKKNSGSPQALTAGSERKLEKTVLTAVKESKDTVVNTKRPVVVHEVAPKKAEAVVAVPPVKAVEVTPVAAPLPAKQNPVTAPVVAAVNPANKLQGDFPKVDRIQQLFTTGPNKLPIVETISYSSSVPWLKGRPAWIADYASNYATSRHFIARSLNGKADYLTQKVQSGSRFNVFRKDKNINFHLLVDASRCKMAFYYVDLDTNERILLKTYDVGVGRLDPQKPSGTLTPLGKYSLGNKIAIYKPGTTGFYQDKKTEMIRIFGTRWIPFDQELEGATESSKGYGIHGAPWREDLKTGQFAENKECMGKSDSDGCVRLLMDDIEELFSIVITKPTFVEIVKDFREAKLPGVEVSTPTR